MARFDIIIPTRARGDVLDYAIRSCLEQDHPNFGVHVLVNGEPSHPTISDPRLSYSYSDIDLPMSANWERAFDLDIPAETRLFFLGDDDALIPGALEAAEGIIGDSDLILAWRKAEYCWPQMAVQPYRNFGYLPLNSTVRRMSGPRFVAASHELQIGYDYGPSIYSAFVPMALLKRVRASTDGTFFRAGSPDVYSAYALGANVDTYLRAEFALSVNGASKHSNGIAYMHDFSGVSATMFRSTFDLHREVSHGPSTRIAEADALLTARDAQPARFSSYSFSFDRLVEELLSEARSAMPARSDALKTAAEAITQKHGLRARPAPASTASSSLSVPAWGYGAGGLTLDMALFGVADAHSAAKIFSAIDPLMTKKWSISEQEKVPSVARRIARKIRSAFIQQ